MPKHLEHGAVAAGQIEAAALCADPHVPLSVLGERGDVRRRDRAFGRIVGKLPDQAGDRVDDVGAAAVRSDPDLAVESFVDRHHPGGAQCARIARLGANG